MLATDDPAPADLERLEVAGSLAPGQTGMLSTIDWFAAISRSATQCRSVPCPQATPPELAKASAKLLDKSGSFETAMVGESE